MLSRLRQVQPVWKEFSVNWDWSKIIYQIDLEWKHSKKLTLTLKKLTKKGAKSLMFLKHV